ncbi:MAG: hypothetical protein R6W78_10445 [Bacteroidales bacterium]
MKTISEKKEFLAAILKGDKATVRKFIKGDPEVFWLENKIYSQFIQGVWRETEKRPEPDDILICYNTPEPVESKVIVATSKRVADALHGMANE